MKTPGQKVKPVYRFHDNVLVRWLNYPKSLRAEIFAGGGWQPFPEEGDISESSAAAYFEGRTVSEEEAAKIVAAETKKPDEPPEENTMKPKLKPSRLEGG